MALSYDQISAITKKYYVPKLIDNIFESNVLAFRLLKKSVVCSGGENIVEPLIYAKGDAEFYSDYDMLDVTPNETISASQWDWKQAHAPITISGLDEIKNSGDAAVIRLLTAKMKIAEKKIKDMFGGTLFKNATGTAKEFTTLYDLIVDYTSTVGNIAGGTYSWWNAKYLNHTVNTSYGNGTVATWAQLQSSTDVRYIQKAMRDMYGVLTDDSDHPTLIITTQYLYDAYEHSLASNKRFVGDQALADAGFQNLAFRGAVVTVDSHVPAGQMFFLNEDYLTFRHHPTRNFNFVPYRKPLNQDAQVAHIFWAGNLTCSNRRRQGVIVAFPTSSI